MSAPAKDLTIRLDIYQPGTFVTAECQFGAHWGCPGGIRREGDSPGIRCNCRHEECECNP